MSSHHVSAHVALPWLAHSGVWPRKHHAGRDASRACAPLHNRPSTRPKKALAAGQPAADVARAARQRLPGSPSAATRRGRIQVTLSARPAPRRARAAPGRTPRRSARGWRPRAARRRPRGSSPRCCGPAGSPPSTWRSRPPPPASWPGGCSSPRPAYQQANRPVWSADALYERR